MKTNEIVDYVIEKLIPAIERHDKRFKVEDMSGSLSVYPLEKITIDNKVCPYLFATPYWESDNGIQVDGSDSEGDYIQGDVLPFTVTGDLTVDVVEYIKQVDGWIKNHSK